MTGILCGSGMTLKDTNIDISKYKKIPHGRGEVIRDGDHYVGNRT